MKVLFIVTRADTVAGTQTHVFEMAKALIAEGNSVKVIVGEGSAYLSLLDENSVDYLQVKDLVREIRPLRDLKAFFAIKSIIGEFKPNLISTHSSKAGILGRFAARLKKVPCLFTAHGWAFTEGVSEPKRTIYRLIEWFMQYFSSHLICVSEADKNLALESGIAESLLTTVRNGRHDLSSRLEQKVETGDGVKLVMVGRLDRQKDHPLLFKALVEVKNLKLDLIGDGPLEGELKALARELGIADRVNFLGLRSDVASLLPSYDIFALISNWEGFPRSTLEAMRSSLPVVVSDVGGAKEAVIEGETGFVVQRGDFNPLVKYLRRLAEDPQLRKNMGLASRKLYEESYTFQKMFEATKEVYQKVLANK